jgi:thioredoxin-like negative regulator of GroEL
VVRVVLTAGVASAALLAAGAGRASVYSPDDPRFAVPVAADGTPQPLEFNEFKRRLAVLTNALNQNLDTPDRQAFLKRIADREKLPKPSPAEAAALAADLTRVGRTDQALNLLGPRSADRRPDYFVIAALAHAHATRGDWAEALRHYEGLPDVEMPAEVKGLSKAQRDWWAKLDADYVPHLYRLRRHESDARRGLSAGDRERADAAEDVLPLFPLPGPGGKADPVRFVNDRGEYEPGKLAEAERAKLPSDAIPVVQQLLLWYPGETRLYWLLAELYAAAGDPVSAAAILDECTWGRQYGNRKVLVAHRQAVRAAADELTRPPDPVTPPISMRTVAIYFAAVGAVAVLALVRTVARRGRGADCGPAG